MGSPHPSQRQLSSLMVLSMRLRTFWMFELLDAAGERDASFW